MLDRLRIEVVDDNCEEEEAYWLYPSEDTAKDLIFHAIGILFPTATSVRFVTEEEE